MAGLEQVLAEIRKRFWVARGREAVRKVLRSCVKCKRLRNNTVTQQMGPISEIRIPHKTSYASQYTAIDAASPFLTKMSDILNESAISSSLLAARSGLLTWNCLRLLTLSHFFWPLKASFADEVDQGCSPWTMVLISWEELMIFYRAGRTCRMTRCERNTRSPSNSTFL